MRCEFQLQKHVLDFAFQAGTSRGVLTDKPTWFIVSKEQGNLGSFQGIGEASPLKGLSEDYSDSYEEELRELLKKLENLEIPTQRQEIATFLDEQLPTDKPSMRFGIETALYSQLNADTSLVVPGPFNEGKYRMPINGLVWMGDEAFMKEQIESKLKAGFSTIKMKVGAIDFETEFQLLANIRKSYSASDITLRVDANGAFDQSNVREVLTSLASLEIHSIEQPIKPGQLDLMAELCREELLPIALDEELIGVPSAKERVELLEKIRPQFIILKPSLVGGLQASEDWIRLAEERNIGWWITSMLESNVGLNAIAQFTAQYQPALPQGLGTGQLYTNNIDSPLTIRKGELLYDLNKSWSYFLPDIDFS